MGTVATATAKTKTAKATATKEKSKEPIKQVILEVFRKNGETFLKFEVAQGLEDIFKKQSGSKVVKSQSWSGLEFYHCPDIVGSKEYKRLLADYGLFDDYGHQFVRADTNQFNIAFLRTVGGKGSVKLGDNLPFASLSYGLQSMQKFLKKYHEDYLIDYKITARLELEI